MDAFMRNDLTIQWNIIPQTDSCIYDETPNCSDDFPNWNKIVHAIHVWAKKDVTTIVTFVHTSSASIGWHNISASNSPLCSFFPESIRLDINQSLARSDRRHGIQSILFGWVIGLLSLSPVVALQYRNCQNEKKTGVISYSMCKHQKKFFSRNHVFF